MSYSSRHPDRGVGVADGTGCSPDHYPCRARAVNRPKATMSRRRCAAAGEPRAEQSRADPGEHDDRGGSPV